MVQNLKIDIIYYNTPSDFEFEFNLGGCCHSRVLNNKSNTPKDMISLLSKAVGRSRIIILIGKLNESDGLFSLISKAIGADLSRVNADEYNIIPETDTTVISGSLPLVSSDGLLSGCILESGPQSIIIMSENKAIRKDIAENLVFKYITAVSRTPETETVVTPDSAPDEPAQAVNEEPTEALTEETVEEVAEQIPAEVFEEVAEQVPAEVLEEAAEQIPVEVFEEAAEQVVAEAFEEAAAKVDETDATDVLDIPEQPVEQTPDEPTIAVTPPIKSEVQSDEDFVLATNDYYPDNEEEAVSDETTEFISNEEFIDIYAEETADIEMDDNYVYNDAPKNYDSEEDNYQPKERPTNQKSGSNAFIWIILGLMFIVVAALTYLLVLTPMQKDVSVIEYIKQVFNL